MHVSSETVNPHLEASKLLILRGIASFRSEPKIELPRRLVIVCGEVSVAVTVTSSIVFTHFKNTYPMRLKKFSLRKLIKFFVQNIILK